MKSNKGGVKMKLFDKNEVHDICTNNYLSIKVVKYGISAILCHVNKSYLGFCFDKE